MSALLVLFNRIPARDRCRLESSSGLWAASNQAGVGVIRKGLDVCSHPMTGAFAIARRMGSANVKDYGVGDGPAAHLLRLIRDAGEDHPTVSELYAKASEDPSVGVRSRRHMKGMLSWMRRQQRVQTRNPPPEKPGKDKNWVFQLTEKGQAHIGKIEAAMGR